MCGMAQPHLLSPKGFLAAGVTAGIKASGKRDVGLLVTNGAPAVAAALFTTNRVFAAPVAVGRDHVRSGKLRGIVMNSGNANACTGKQGHKDALRMCELAAETLGAQPDEFLPSSTGIIGHHLPMMKVEAGIREAATQLGDTREHAEAFMEAILTTDLVRKEAAVTFKLGKSRVTLAGVCKGSGMIGPRLGAEPGVPLKGLHATMLAYLTTDAVIDAASLRKLLPAAARRSFNSVTVDDHTSTNDTLALLASGASGVKILGATDLSKFAAALDDVCVSLAKQIAADGEGATKLVNVIIRNAATDRDANLMARSIANSPLLKCALNGNDPNWGRIVSAAGMSGAKFDPDKADLKLQGTLVFRHGTPVPFDAAAVSRSMDARSLDIILTCNDGTGQATVYTCDFSKEYVAINADYHT
jgi:glutamate N-acetyltransferase / amino-acid N-acetyltransferase